MQRYTHILFPTALVQRSLLIGKRAAQLASRADAKLSLLHVIEQPYKYRFLIEGSDAVDSELINSRNRQLLELGKALSVPVTDQYIRIGAPKIHILDVARQIGPDLIVVASHAHHGYMHVLGSSAIAVAHSAPCDVLTIRVNGTITENYRHILFPTALVEHSAMVAERAASMASSFGAKLSLLHVVEPVPGYGFGAVTADEIENGLEKQAMKQLVELAKGIGVPEQDLYIKTGSPKLRILETADELAADLIITASHGRHGVAHLLGSTAISVVHSARCDVLTVRIKETTVTAI